MLYFENYIRPYKEEKMKICLKGPKREIFGLGFFAQIRPIWIGY